MAKSPCVLKSHFSPFIPIPHVLLKMRLIRVNHDKTSIHKKLQLIEEFGNGIPEYTILSHTWGSDEVLYDHICSNTASEHLGYSKVTGAIQQTSKDGFDYLWIDSCCIDKSSSAELSEALNSMFAWYAKAAKCYALLEDVPEANTEDFRAKFVSSRWFTRGWTLQELLAPGNIEFFGIGESGAWTSLGNRNSLQGMISERTTIDIDYLTGIYDVHHASVAKRMSWAAGRQTKREEDIAYCLLGLFSVNMPMLYGEGPRAFLRLQEEIMKHSDDQSIFAWTTPAKDQESTSHFHQDDDEEDNGGPLRPRHGLLADSPAAFARSGRIVPWSDSEDRVPYEMSNRGLSIQLHLTPQQDNIIGAALECHLESEDDTYLGVFLVRLGEGSNQYARVACERLCRGAVTDRGRPEKLYIRQDVSDKELTQPARFLSLRELHNLGDTYKATKVMSSEPSIVSARQQDAARRNYPFGLPHARLWIPSSDPTVFEMPYKPRELITVVTFTRQSDNTSFFVLIGTLTDSHLGIAMSNSKSQEHTRCEPLPFGDFSSLQALFRLHASPTSATTRTEDNTLEAAVWTYIELGRKLYIVDLKIENITKAQPGNVSRMANQMSQQKSGQRKRKDFSWLSRWIGN